MRRTGLALLTILVAAPIARAQDVTWVIPAFAEQVNGANGSTLQSELRLTNELSATMDNATNDSTVFAVRQTAFGSIPAQLSITARS